MKGKQLHRIPEERYVAARVIYETTPGATFASVAEETGVSARSLEERSKVDGGWTRRALLPPQGLTEAAQAVADRYTGKLAEYENDPTPAQKQAVVQSVAAEVAVDIRAQLLDRHRKEWSVFRSRVYKQVDPKSGLSEDERFNMSKTTKINAETLQIIQQNERKAYGLEKGEGDDKKVTLVIDRGE